MMCPKCGRVAEQQSVICSACDYILDPSFLWEDTAEELRDAAPDADHDLADRADATQEVPSLSLLLGEEQAHHNSLASYGTDRATEAENSQMPAGAPPAAPWERQEAPADAELLSWLMEASVADVRMDAPTGFAVENEFTTGRENAGFPSETEPVLLGNLSEEYDVFLAQDTNWFLTAATREVDRPVQSVPLYLSKSVREMLRPAAVLAREETCDAALTALEEHILQFVDGQRPLGRVTVLTGLAQQDVEIAVSMMAEKRVVRLVGQATRPTAEQADESGPAPAPPLASTSPAAPPAHTPNENPGGLPPGPKVARPSANFGQRQEAQRLQPKKKIATAPPPKQAPENAAPAPSKPQARIQTELFERAKKEEAAGNHVEAIALLRRCVAEQPYVAGFHNRLGVVLAAREKDYKNAIVHLTKATELQPENPIYRNNLGKIIAAAAAMDEESAGGQERTRTGLWAAFKKIF